MTDVISLQYDQLDQISSQCDALAEETQNTHKAILQTYTPLKDGGRWKGDAANAFFTNMERSVFTSYTNLEQTLQQLAQQLRQVSKSIQQAEQEASASFRSDVQTA